MTIAPPDRHGPAMTELDEARLIEKLHAVASAPSMVPPSAWLPVALGDRELDGALLLPPRPTERLSKPLGVGRVDWNLE